MAWLIVLSDAAAAKWVIETETMAFRASAHAERLATGDRFAIYVSRGAHGNPTRDEAQIVAVGTISSPVVKRTLEVAGHRYGSICSLAIETSLPLRGGVPFRPLIKSLDFIRVKDSWAAYVRRTIVEISEQDYAYIAAAVSTTPAA